MNIMKYNDIQNLEFRKGSLEYGDKIKQLIEFLRIYKNENDDKLIFNINDFEKSSKITLSEVEEIKNLPYKKNLINFDIDVKDNKIIFSNLQNKKSIHTESLKILKFNDFFNM